MSSCSQHSPPTLRVWVGAGTTATRPSGTAKKSTSTTLVVPNQKTSERKPQNGTHIQRTSRSDRMGAGQRRRHHARIEEAVRRRPRDAELRPGQGIGDAAHPPAHQLQASRQGTRTRPLPLPEKPEYGLLTFDEPKPTPKDERERETRIQWAKDFRAIADWLDTNCHTTED